MNELVHKLTTIATELDNRGLFVLANRLDLLCASFGKVANEQEEFDKLISDRNQLLPEYEQARLRYRALLDEAQKDFVEGRTSELEMVAKSQQAWNNEVLPIRQKINQIEELLLLLMRDENNDLIPEGFVQYILDYFEEYSPVRISTADNRHDYGSLSLNVTVNNQIWTLRFFPNISDKRNYIFIGGHPSEAHPKGRLPLSPGTPFWVSIDPLEGFENNVSDFIKFDKGIGEDPEVLAKIKDRLEELAIQYDIHKSGKLLKRADEQEFNQFVNLMHARSDLLDQRTVAEEKYKDIYREYLEFSQSVYDANPGTNMYTLEDTLKMREMYNASNQAFKDMVEPLNRELAAVEAAINELINHRADEFIPPDLIRHITEYFQDLNPHVYASEDGTLTLELKTDGVIFNIIVQNKDALGEHWLARLPLTGSDPFLVDLHIVDSEGTVLKSSHLSLNYGIGESDRGLREIESKIEEMVMDVDVKTATLTRFANAEQQSQFGKLMQSRAKLLVKLHDLQQRLTEAKTRLKKFRDGSVLSVEEATEEHRDLYNEVQLIYKDEIEPVNHEIAEIESSLRELFGGNAGDFVPKGLMEYIRSYFDEYSASIDSDAYGRLTLELVVSGIEFRVILYNKEAFHFVNTGSVLLPMTAGDRFVAIIQFTDPKMGKEHSKIMNFDFGIGEEGSRALDAIDEKIHSIISWKFNQ